MNHTQLLARVGLAAAASLATLVPLALHRGDETAEPPARYVLEVGGERYTIATDEPFEIALGEAKHRARLVALPTRQLVAGGFSFEYPRHMSFEYAEEDGDRDWTLDGNDATAMLFVYESVSFTPGEFESYQAMALESMGTVRTDETEIDLGGRSVPATEIRVRANGFALVALVVALDEGDEQRSFLVLQDVRDRATEPTEEFVELLRLLGTTFGRVL